MPYPNEHAARQYDPKRFVRFRRMKFGGRGISAIIGVLPGTAGTAVQALRFDRRYWTAHTAKEWLREHGFKTTGFVAARGR